MTFVTGMIPLVLTLRNPVLQRQPFPSIAKTAALCYNGCTLYEREEACRMRKLRRFIWYLAGRLLLSTVL